MTVESPNYLLSYEAAPTVPRLSMPMMAGAEGELNAELFALMNQAPENANQFRGKKIAFLVANGVEEGEFLVPYRWAQDRGAEVTVIAPDYSGSAASFGLQMPEICRTHVLTVKYMENAGYFRVDKFLSQVTASDYDAVIIPGGAWSPDTLRVTQAALEFVRAMMTSGKVIASICHGPWVLISAGILKGKKATAVWAVQPDVANAGAVLIDEPVVVDGNLITSRYPFDMPRFVKAIGERLTA